MTATEIIDLLVGLIADAATLIGDVHTGIISTTEAESRIAQALAKIATDKQTEAADFKAKFGEELTPVPGGS